LISLKENARSKKSGRFQITSRTTPPRTSRRHLRQALN
jgi:hypothetical protein